MITEQKALTMARLENLVRTKSDDYFTKVTRGEKTLCVAYTNTDGFLSVILSNKDKMYAFIKESLTDKQREAELKLIFDNKELHYYSSNEIVKMEELVEQHKSKKKVIKNITHGDIENIVKNYDLTFGEVSGAIDLTDIIKKFNKFDNNDIKWNTACAMAFAFKLGEMQGKREERSKRKVSQIIGGALC